MAKIKPKSKKIKRLKRDIEKRKFPYITVEDTKTGKTIVHPLISTKRALRS